MTTQALPQLERYQIIEEIGRGGMAVVYLARHRRLDRLEALKRLQLPIADDPVAVKRFLREAQIAAALQHPSIATVYDCFEQEGVPYIAMEYARRGSLGRVGRRLTLEESAGVLRDVLAGLSAADASGIVHRDLKPENLLVSDAGSVKIADFGLAKAVGELVPGDSLTATGMIVGTPAYMAPEQALGEPVGTWTDLYALGVIAYELLVGTLPFSPAGVTPVSVLVRHVQSAPRDPREACPDIDAELSGWIMRLLARDPAGRPAHPADAWNELEPIVVRLAGAQWPARAAIAEPPKAPDEEDSGYVTFHERPPDRPPEDEPLDDEIEPDPDAQSELVVASDAEAHVEAHSPVRATLRSRRDDPEPAAGELELDAGQEGVLFVHVRNEGDTTAKYTLDVAGIPATWWSAEPAALHLNPWSHGGEHCEDVATLSFQPPHDSSALARRWPLDIAVHEVKGADRSTARAHIAAALTIRPFVEFTAQLRPEEPSGRRRAAFAVWVANRGNSPLDLALEAHDTEGACTLTLPATVQLGAGTESRVTGRIAARRWRWFGNPLARRFAVTAVPNRERRASTVLNGVFWHRRLLPWWPIPIALALVAAVAAIAALSGSSDSGSGTHTVTPGPTESATPTETAKPPRAARPVTVPNIVGRSAADARDRIEAAGLELGTIRPRGLPDSTAVKQQEPSAGEKARRHSSVNLILETVKVPDLVGLSLADARDRLEAESLSEGDVEPFDAADDAIVSKQKPSAGRAVEQGREVDLVLSPAAPPGLTESEATEAAQRSATTWARGFVGASATVDGCEQGTGDQWQCTASVEYATADGGTGTCSIDLEAFPTNDIADLATESGGFAGARITDTSDCPS
jgi:serine/threonine protein kinase